MTTANNTINTGIKTRRYNNEPFGYIVEWMEWDSGFRHAGLQYGDLITGVNDTMYHQEDDNAVQSKSIGGYLEAQFFAETGWDEQQPVTIHVYRDEQSIEIKGMLREERTYLNSEGRAILGDNGPVRISNDGFASAWAGWYEKLARHLILYLDDKRWERTAIDNRSRLAEHLEWKERIDFLCMKYPGRFADSVLADWELARKILEGIRYDDITAATLEYRGIGLQRVSAVKAASQQARQAFLEAIAVECIAPFPAIDAVYGDTGSVAGKKVVLPAISFDNFINDLGKSFAVIGNQKNGFYFIHLNSPEMDLFFRTLFHYKAQVTPDVPEQFDFIAEILNIPTILTYEGRSVTGVMVKVLAGTAGGDHVFINTMLPAKEGKTSFAGEDSLVLFAAPVLDAAASPQQTVEAMIHYIKLGDMNAWKKLFASWQIYFDQGGPPYMDMVYWMPEEAYQNAWEKSRRLILNEVYDARIIYTAPVKTVVNENPATGVPRVEQVKIIVDHIGKFEGVYRSVSNLYVHRNWILQRLDGGPWKIKELQGL